ncbi:hypothetical protein [Cellulomonas oligotrophica]|uniref:MinD-like ATPase involved in chromosome partitioning or flagellar assembly n=3 Tax=Cellulomonas oligotrophica TaxID=931536 RepID=A0A7Y9FGG0_9CELL|nr:hypothetical protein [Cellulomonas oligotrophica]NYD86875.1 MinD-like ATPase involved in chromosome partitioning or flagellar assembly [Cellulomonas oligotrophica]GIG32339.1 hypothetical protein Col01nite_14980 [Cellulomonas oligotrophica]
MRVLETVALAARGTGPLARRLADADAAMRRPVSTSRRVGVVQVDGGAGATTTVAGSAAVLARRRGGGVLAVDAARGPAALGAALALDAPLPWTTDAASLHAGGGASRGSQVRARLPHGPTGVAVLGDGSASAPWPPDPQRWRELVDPVGRFFDVVLTDWGVRSDAETARVAAEHHVLVVATRTERGPLERAVARAAAWATAPHAPAVVLLAVDVARTGDRDASLARAAGLTTLVVPHDAHLAARDPRTPTVPGTAVRTAWSDVAARLLALASDPGARLGVDA